MIQWTHECHAAHGENDDAGMFWRVIGDSAQVGLDDMISIEERKFSVWFDPDLVLCILGQIVERGDVQSKLARLRELAEADA